MNFNTFILCRMGFLIKIEMCVAEKSASISVMACFNVQRSYNYEISSHSLVSMFLNICVIVKFYY
jgi:hypothetical protein